MSKTTYLVCGTIGAVSAAIPGGSELSIYFLNPVLIALSAYLFYRAGSA